MSYRSRLRLREVQATSAFRLTLVLGSLFAAAMVIMAVVIYTATAQQLIVRSEGMLQRESLRLLNAPSHRVEQDVKEEVARNAKGLDHFGLISADGLTRLAGDIGPYANVVLDHPSDVPDLDGQAAMRVLASRRGDGRIVVVGRDISERRYLLTVVLEVIVGALAIILPGALLIGALISRPSLRRIRDLQSACRRIAVGELDVRMPVAGRGDELDQVAITINDMVGDLERVVSQVKNVTDAIAHDLRTPLTRVKSHLLDYHDRARDGELAEDQVAQLSHDLDLVLERFAALLRIAEIEASARTSRFAEVDLGELVATAAMLHAPVAEDNGIGLTAQVSSHAPALADPQLMLEALSNLIDNALKFAGTAVSVLVTEDGDRILISVSDDGPGIPAAERDAVLQRFYRRGEQDERSGMGLGLSIVSAILHLHKFQLVLEDAHPGLCATIIAHKITHSED
ncbi:HAMP domain-containing protein [Sphingomonas sp. AP4-R1]|uniref:ATP-binding protein n=1 Tax=Sphingomonas sp. AP4-R1 TaxID=2735134 RepID=UPI0014933AC3|nr:ATP-binding protein [Sphingomonas sp. AP4-R1]QJU57350.1 HAMP domain-containing protein [Sphingomonas sp. AP4-R1]